MDIQVVSRPSSKSPVDIENEAAKTFTAVKNRKKYSANSSSPANGMKTSVGSSDCVDLKFKTGHYNKSTAQETSGKATPSNFVFVPHMNSLKQREGDETPDRTKNQIVTAYGKQEE